MTIERLYDANHIHGDRKRGIPPVIPMAHSTFWERVQSGVYPPGRKYGARRYWTEGEVQAMVETITNQRIEGRL
ncbi:MAG: hypothetical protein O2868_03220, partial [Proteobacteria bacterium]|nr:hypothetical protein [Pseudomonadota bacterium]